MFDDWREALIIDPLGKIWWYNLQFDLAHENLPPEINDSFLEAVRDRIDSLGTYLPPLDPLVGVLDSMDGAAVSFSLQGRRRPEAEPFSRVVKFDDFALYNIDLAKLGLSQKSEHIVWEMFRDGDIVPELHFKGSMKTGRPFFWGTPTRRLEEVFQALELDSMGGVVHPPEKGDRAATEIRNLLGLSYMSEGIGLYRIDIPARYLSAAKFRAPTTLDSSPRCVFLPADEQTPYGWTLHLEKLERGAEEVVVNEIEFTHDYKVTQLGFIRGPLPNEDAVWAALEAMVEGRLNGDA